MPSNANQYLDHSAVYVWYNAKGNNERVILIILHIQLECYFNEPGNILPFTVIWIVCSMCECCVFNIFVHWTLKQQ